MPVQRSAVWDLGTVCASCRRSIQRRCYSSAATGAAIASDVSNHHNLSSTNESTSSPKPVYQLRAGIVLSRPPIITRDLHPFEKAFYLYQRRLNERLALPFTRYFYYKKGTPGDVEWKHKIKARLTPARDIGVYDAYGEESWNDELLVGAKESEPAHQREALLQDAEAFVPDSAMTAADASPAASKKAITDQPMERITKADREKEMESLDRLLQRTLYLLVRDSQGTWSFPSLELSQRESLRSAAERLILDAAGSNINTWIVGHAPVGHYATELAKVEVKADHNSVELGQKTFFMKARVMAGQVNLQANHLGLKEFRWLSKEEIQQLVTPRYWDQTGNMLCEL